jgi:hypothetical protein
VLEKIVKLIVAVLLFVCLADLPYGYYQFVRFVALVSFAFLSYKNYERNEKALAFIFAALAVLFQPLFKIYLGREIWNAIDVIVGIGLIVTIFLKPKNTNEV